MTDKITPNYGLPLYTDGDPADMRDKYNRAMEKIDAQMRILEVRLRSLENRS